MPPHKWRKQNQQYEDASCPNIVKAYNRRIGGVDMMDSLIGCCKILNGGEKYQQCGVSCPNIVEECNSHMGGINFIESN